ncbi:zinc transporter ZIP1-like [Teleopsis dalmanni]|uniref:zinc transporter ZIP1-like n=1 Tax=Teleopsis dalmanni TaxID=139649 RepID=UPI0018CE2F70|nr:zinc transporter ZIP1-like [Teleopsis dalmanni]
MNTTEQIDNVVNLLRNTFNQSLHYELTTTTTASTLPLHSSIARDNSNEGDKALLIAKVITIVIMFIATVICSGIPFLLNRYFKWTENNTDARSATVVKCLLYFGGGVLICTTFLHVLPDVQEDVHDLQHCGYLPELTFGLPEMLMCAGFFLMFFIDELVHTFLHNHKPLLEEDDGAGAAFERGHSFRNSVLFKPKNPKKFELAENETSVATISVTETDNVKLENGNSVPERNNNNVESNNTEHAVEHNHKHQQNSHSHSHMPVVNSEGDAVTSSLRGLFIVMALSLHELFEGMAIGLAGTASSVWFMFGAVAAHKLVLAFCVGVELIVARTRRGLVIVYLFTFAIVSPIGIGIGIAITNTDDMTSTNMTAAILNGLACGTLLYVVFFEILSKEHAGLLSYLMLLIGFGVMFGLQQLGADDHDHGDSCDGADTETTHQLIVTESTTVQ